MQRSPFWSRLICLATYSSVYHRSLPLHFQNLHMAVHESCCCPHFQVYFDVNHQLLFEWTMGRESAVALILSLFQFLVRLVALLCSVCAWQDPRLWIQVRCVSVWQIPHHQNFRKDLCRDFVFSIPLPQQICQMPFQQRTSPHALVFLKTHEARTQNDWLIDVDTHAKA